MNLVFTLNGNKAEWDVHPGETFFETLKNEGFFAKVRGCSTGDCGVCIVKMNGENVHSCQVFSGSVESQDVVMYEGVVYKDQKTGEVKVKQGKETK